MPSRCICEGAGLRDTIRADIDRFVFAIDRDALSRRSYLPRLCFSPRVWTTINYRIIHYALTRMRPRIVGRLVFGFSLVIQRMIRNSSGIQITHEAHIGPGLLFVHEGGIVIGPVRMGRHCTLSHGVTVGRGLLDGDGPSYADTPTLGDRVWLGPGAVVAGRIEVGSDAAVGANSVVLRDVPARGVVLGVPARLVSHKGSFSQVTYRGMEKDAERAAAQCEIGAAATPHDGGSGRPQGGSAG
jgi:serine O-acetyltransferase